MHAEMLVLQFSQQVVDQPIIYRLVKDFNLNRLRAETEKSFNQSISQTIDPPSGSGGSGTAGGGSASPAT